MFTDVSDLCSHNDGDMSRCLIDKEHKSFLDTDEDSKSHLDTVEEAEKVHVCYFMKDEVLIRKWRLPYAIVR